MKKRILSLLILLALLIVPFSFTACGEDEKPAVTDCVFSSFTAEDFNGNIVDETVFAGYKVTMINVWGTYCEPCKRELPALAELNAEYENFQVIGIPVDATLRPTDAKQIMEQTATYRHLRISTGLKSFISGIKSIPYTIFVNGSGQQIGAAYSGAKSKSEWKKLIDKML